MSKQSVSGIDVAAVMHWLRSQPQYNHIHVRTRGDLLILESGPEEHRIPHARLRRLDDHLWALEMPHRSRWQPMPYNDSSPEQLLDLLREAFGWMLLAIE